MGDGEFGSNGRAFTRIDGYFDGSLVWSSATLRPEASSRGAHGWTNGCGPFCPTTATRCPTWHRARAIGLRPSGRRIELTVKSGGEVYALAPLAGDSRVRQWMSTGAGGATRRKPGVRCVRFVLFANRCRPARASVPVWRSGAWLQLDFS